LDNKKTNKPKVTGNKIASSAPVETKGTHKIIHVLSEHTDNVLAMVQHDNFLFSGSSDATIKVS
jgi:hypothetical protein